MENKSRMDDNASASDQISHGLASSISENKPSIQNLRDADVSTVSSERVQSSEHSSIRSDVGSGSGKTVNETRKKPGSERVKEVSQGDSTSMIPCSHKQLKSESWSSKESAAVAQLSSVGFSTAQPLSTSGCSQPTQSDGSKNAFQEPESSRIMNCEFDLNVEVEEIGEDCDQKSINESNSSQDALQILEPIPVLAKVGVPIGLPEKPLQFGGELGWRRLGVNSAFRPTFSKNSDIEKGSGGTLDDCCSNAPLDRGFDLNIAANVDLEVHVDKPSVDGGSQKPERFQFIGQRGSENFHKPGTSIDLNENPMMEIATKNFHRQSEARQAFRKCDAIDTATYSGGNGSQITSDSRRSPYWVDLSSVQGHGHVQGRPLLLGAPTADQVQMMVPIQLAHTPSGLYIGKINGLTPTFYPPGVVPSFHNQQGVAAITQISGPVLTAYPGNVHLLESSPGLSLSPRAYANMRQTILPNGSIALVGNGSRGLNSTEVLIPTGKFEDRMKHEQVAFPTSSTKRQEPDTGWGSSQMNCRQMASWN